MSETMTADTIKQSVADNDVRFLRLSFNDINGKVKSVEVPKSQLDKVLTNQIRFDGSSINGYVNIQNSDLVLYPDFKTWTILPWADATGGRVGRLICSVHQTDGQPFEGDPRNNLERVLGHLKKFGLTEFDVGFEAEFHLFKLSEDGNWTTQVPDHASYFDIEAADKCASCRRDIVETLEKMGFVVEAAHHEVGDGQQEIDFRFDDALTTADRVQTFKMVVRQVARRHGFYATFMAKPLKGEAGNGMHTNMSLFKGKTNVFYDAQSATHLSKTALYFLNGILTHARAITALGNPTVNSYKRLIPGFEAPVYISWGVKNRTVLVRVPDAGVKTTRLELRSADPTANPYLLLAACLTAGLEGIKERQLPIKRTEDNLFTMSAAQRAQRNIKPLPSTLHNAIKSFQADSLMEEALGKHLTNSFIHVKKQEWFEYNQSVSDWERNHYMDY